MRRLLALSVVLCAAFAVGVGVRAGQQQEDPQAIFRTGVDLIRLDVSVLDKARRPVRGLTADAFTVLENGKPQRIVAVSEIDAREHDPMPSAWMRHATRDVAGNDLADQLGYGRAVAIVLDESNIPDESGMQVATRDLARHIIESLGPSDLAAVVFPLNPGKTQDFTHDRSKLFEAVDRFKAEQREFQTFGPQGVGPRQGDVVRYSSVLNRDPCLQMHPAIPTLHTVTSRLATIPNQRKSIFFLSVGLPVPFAPGRTRCDGLLYDELRLTFREAQRANVNIHGVDPGGPQGFQKLLQDSRLVHGRMTEAADAFSARQMAERRHDFLVTAADQTGGRAVVDSATVEADIDQVFAETSAYYLIGYETSNGAPDGKFRHVDVRVNGKDLAVRTSAGYWAPDKDKPVANDRRDAPTSNSLNISGMASPQKLVLRAGVHPIGRAAAPGKNAQADLAAVLTVRVPAPRQSVSETLTVIRTIENADGNSTAPIRETTTLTLEPVAGDTLRYDVLSTFSLPPGRYEIRFNASSQVADASGTVYAEVEVPDFSKSGLMVSGVVLGADVPGPRTDPLAALTPIVPTTARDFIRGERVTAFVKISQGGSVPIVPVEVLVSVLGAEDTEVVHTTSTLAPDAFSAARAAEFRTELPLSRLTSGLYLLSITARLDGRSVRRDVVFHVQ